MGRVIYDSKRLIPAPTVSISKQYNKTGAGRNIGTLFSISLQGTLLSWKGSPTSSGSFWTIGGYPGDETVTENSKLQSILTKQAAIRELFSNEGLQLEIQSDDGSAATKCNPRVISIDFPEGIWNQTCQYTINLEADRLYPQDEDLDSLGSSYFINDASETWTLETDEATAESLDAPRSYRLTHSISAQGKRTYNSVGGLTLQPWQNARAFVISRLGLDTSFITSSGVNNLAGYYGGYNYIRNESVDVEGGSHSVTENWVITSGTAFESFEVSSNYNLGDGLTKVSINGNVTGLEQRDSNLNLTTKKYDNALVKFSGLIPNMLSRAQLYSGTSLNITPNSNSIGRNPLAGTISYSYEYDNRPSNAISGSLVESIVVTDVGNSEEFAAIPVLGRAAGPVLQPLGTSQAINRSLAINANFGPQTINMTNRASIQSSLLGNPRTWANTSGDILNIIAAVNPTNNGAYQTFKSQPQESWEPKTGSYSYSINWTYENP